MISDGFTEPGFRSGFVAVVGRPNVGKSTLVNRLVGEKVSITSPRAQTTRSPVRGVRNGDGYQAVFVDTPGSQKPRDTLRGRMQEQVVDSLSEADVILLVLDAADLVRSGVGGGDRYVARLVSGARTPVIACINKADLLDKESDALPLVDEVTTLGEWKPGDMIPSELELAARYKVSQGTVRKAIDELATDNLLVRRQGKGTFVATHAEQHVQYRFLKLVPDEGAPDSEGPAQRRIVDCKRLRASAEVARALALRSGDPVLQVRRVLAYRQVPTILEDLWLPGAPFKGLTAERLAQWHGPMYALFETEFGVRMIRAEERISAVAADPDAAELLAVPVGAPLLSVERLSMTYGDRPVEWRLGRYDTDSHHYRNELS